jgi:hypothetical protein
LYKGLSAYLKLTCEVVLCREGKQVIHGAVVVLGRRHLHV